jgi:sporulation protein YlmC with PRC-barrel domain
MNPTSEYDGGGEPSTRLLHELIGLQVRFADGRNAGNVHDVRLAPSDRVRGVLSELVTDGLVVGRPRPGTLLGYDRSPEQGPAIVRVLVRVIHRHTGYVPWTSVVAVDFDSGEVRLSVDSLDRLERA